MKQIFVLNVEIKDLKNFEFKGAQINFTYCHQIPERSFFWKKKQFPLCARCTGINLGYLFLPLFIYSIIEIPLYWTALMIIPTYIDGVIQAFYNVESNNSRRFVTGLLSGIGTMSLISIMGLFIGKQILLLIN